MSPQTLPQVYHRMHSAFSALRIHLKLLLCGLLLFTLPASATANPPDLTNGGEPNSSNRLNLGPTGMFGWIYWGGTEIMTSASRQILVSRVDAGSPADGIILPGDVILGASGTGIDPVAFSDDARISYALAIADAETNSPAILKLLRWRDGVTDIASIELETLGTYSATAPYNCPKSALLLEKSLDYLIDNLPGEASNSGLLAILAANDPDNPKNEVRQAFVKEKVYAILPSAAEMQRIMDNVVPEGRSAWNLGYNLILISEYYLQTEDPDVLPGLEALAVLAANGLSHLGTVGHRLNSTFSGPLDRAYMRGYGTMNSAGLPLYYGLLLANEAGVDHPAVLDGIDKATNTYASYSRLGRYPYGEHSPFFPHGHAANGKSGTAALAFMLADNRVEETKFSSKMSVASIGDREFGHTGSYFNELWTPLGAAAGGEEAGSAHFKEIRWMLDLARQWDGNYYWNEARKISSANAAAGHYNGVAMLGYALPLRQIHMTGRGHDPARYLSSQEVADALTANDYDATIRTTAELVEHLGFWSPPVRFKAAVELGNRTAEHAALRPQIIDMAKDTSAGDARLGACLALGFIAGSDAATALVELFEDPDYRVRYFAGEGFSYMIQTGNRDDAVPLIDAALIAAAAIQRPFNPRDEDPMQFGQSAIYSAIFGENRLLGTNRINTYQVNRNLLYPAFKAAAEHPMAPVRSNLRHIYPHLTDADFNALAGVIVDATAAYAPADKMNADGIRRDGVRALMDRGPYRESIPLLSNFMHDYTPVFGPFVDDLKQLGAAMRLIEPDPKIEELLYLISQYHLRDHLQEDAHDILAAIESDLDPIPMISLKTIHSVMATPAQLSLPSQRSTLFANTSEIGDSGSTFTWRKIHGRGQVNFIPNGTTDADRTNVYFDGTPGVYGFEVTMIDKHGLVLIKDTVEVALRDFAGNLPANQAPVANAQSLSVPSWTPTPITLTGSDPDGQPLNFRVIQQPAHGSLSGTAPHLVYTSNSRYTGPDSFIFEVIDSEGATDVATISLNVNLVSEYPEVAIYEPFQYLAGGLNGKSGPAEVGFAGAWQAASGMQVVNSSLPYGDLITKGGHLAPTASGSAYRMIDATALAERGLLDDGAELWFSMVAEKANDATTFTRFHLALANNSFSGDVAWRVAVPDDGAVPGSGFGAYMNQGVTRATQYNAEGFIEGTRDLRDKEFNQYIMDADEKRLIVGRFSWADDPSGVDRLEIFITGPNLELSLDRPLSFHEAIVDQSAFDRLNLWVDGRMRVDEIRFASSYRGVILGTQAEIADTDSPGNGIASFQQLPTVVDASSIAMSAATDFDPSGVEYYFTCTAGGGNDSGWQSSPHYIDTGLTAGVTYTYTVTVRDLSPAQNTSAPSAPASATISAETAIPDLSGLQRDLAEEVLATLGFTLGSVTAEYRQTIPLNEVLGQSPDPGVSAARGTAVDLLVSDGPDPALPFLSPANITSNIVTSSTLEDDPVTYTLTFNMEMDASTILASDFVNLGTAPIVIHSITQTSPGVFTVVLTPTQGGTLRLGIIAGASIASASGDWLDTTLPINDDRLYEVIPVNDPPVWLSNPLVAAPAVEGFPYLSGLIDDVYDEEGDFLTFTKVSGPAWLTIKPDGEMTGVPALANVGLNSFVVSVSDGKAPAVQATVQVTVEEAARTVVFFDDFEVASGSPDVNAADSAGDTSKQTNTAKWVRGTSGFGGDRHGIVDESSGFFTDPAGEQAYALRHGNAGITSVEGAIGSLTAGATYTISFDIVLDQMDAASGLRQNYNVGLLTFAPGASRTDTRNIGNGALQVLASRTGSGATTTYQRQTFTYVATGNESSLGMDLAVRLRGSITSAIIDNVQVTVSQPGFGVVGIDASISGRTTRATVPVVYTFRFNKDIDATSLDAADFGNFGTADVVLGAISEISPGVVTVEVTPLDVGSLRMGIVAGATILDAQGEALDTTAAILDYSVYEVTPENTPPFWLSDPVVKMNAFYGQAYADSLVGSAADAEDPVLTFAKVSGPTWLSVAPDGSLSGTPAKNHVGLNRFRVSVTDGKTPPMEGRLEIQVINVNDPPVWTSDPVFADNAPIRSLYSYNLSENAFDADGNALVFALISGPSWASVSEEGWLIGQPKNTDLGLNSFVVSVSDGIAAPITVTVEIEVVTTDVNEPPVFTINPIVTRDASVDTLYFGTIAGSATDPDGDAVIYAKVSGPAWLVVESDGSLAGTPEESDFGPNSFIVSASDNIAAPVQATLNIEVREANDAPVFSSDPIVGNHAMENNIYTGTLAGLATDAEGDPLVFAKVSGPAWLNVASNGALSGMPLMTGDAGPNSFIVSVSDGINPPVEATLNIEVLVQPEEYVWTGAAGPGSDWNDAANWQNGNVPSTSATSNRYTVNSFDRVVIFDSETAVGGYMPTATLTSSNEWFGNYPNWNLSPATIVRNGTLNFGSTGAQWWHVGDAEIDLEVGDGDMGSLAVVNMGWRNVSRYLKNTSNGLVFKVNRDGTVNQIAGLEYLNAERLVRIELNGGQWNVAGIVQNLAVGTDAAMRTISFDAAGAEFSAQFGGDFPDLAAVNAEIGSSFVDTTGHGIFASDNGDGTFTVAVTNTAPVWLSNPVMAANAVEGLPYQAAIADAVSDADGDELVFAKVSGPAWLNVASDGTLSGTPSSSDMGVNSFTVSVSDGINPAVEATLNIEVLARSTEYVWTGAVDGDWENPANWDANGAPVDSNPGDGGLGFASSEDDRIIINATSFSPTINVPQLYATNNTSVTPNVDVINGSVAFNLNSSISGQHVLNADATMTIGDGDWGNGFASLTYNNPGTFRRGGNFTLDITVNSDGTLNFGNDTTVSFDTNKLLHVTLAGGSTVFDGWIRPLRNSTSAGNSWFDFTAAGASFTAKFGGAVFTDLGVVNAFIDEGEFFRSSTGLTLAVTDNGDGTFTIAAMEPNSAPIWLTNPVVVADADEGMPYAAGIADAASDDDGDELVFAKVSGPAWLSVASDGTLSGTPSSSDVGVNSFTVSVSDGINPAVEATLNIEVLAAYPLASFAIKGIPSVATVNMPIENITITAVDENGQPTTAFSGTVIYGGTAGITGTSANFVNGVLENVSITPMTMGKDFTFTVDDGAGHLGTITFNVLSASYSDWALANGLTGEEAAPDAIIQGDGLTNLQKFAFGMDPAVASTANVEIDESGNVSSGTPVMMHLETTATSVDLRAVFTRRKDHQTAGIRYTVQFSADVANWVTSNTSPTAMSDPQQESDVEAVYISYPLFIRTDLGFQKPRFFRVGVSIE